MGILDMVESMAGGAGGAGQNGQVAGGLMQELQSRPGGLGGSLQSLQGNGMGGAVQQWGSGQTQPASPDQVEQGLGGTGLIDSVAQRTGMSPTMVKAGLAVALPLIVHHMVSNGHVTPDGQPTGQPMPEPGGMLQSILGRMV